MKILHITQCLYEGGVTNVVINIIKAFSKIGVENIIIAPDVAEEMLRQLKRYTSSVYLIGCSVKPIDSFKYILTKWGLVEEIVQHENPDAIMIQPGWLSLFHISYHRYQQLLLSTAHILMKLSICGFIR